MNVVIENTHYGCERNSWKDWAWLERERVPSGTFDKIGTIQRRLA